MAEGFKEVLAKLDEISRNMENRIQNLDIKVSNYQQQINKVIIKIENVEAKFQKMNEGLESYRNRVTALERSCREKNIIIYNLKDTDGLNMEQLENKVMALFKDTLNVVVNWSDFDRIYAIGDKSKKNRPIMVKFISFRKKLEVFKMIKQLKGTNITLANDYPLEVRKIRKKLLPFLFKARNMRYQAIMRYNKLIVNGESYTLEELNMLKHEDIFSTGSNTSSEYEESENETEINTKISLQTRQKQIIPPKKYTNNKNK